MGGRTPRPACPVELIRPPNPAFWARVDSSAGPLACWPWIGRRDPEGYGIYGVHSKRATRLAYEQAHQRVLYPVAVIRHACDNPPCCNPLHLVPGTQLMNVADRVERDRNAKGVTNGRARLSEVEAISIFLSPLSTRMLAGLYGVSHYTVHDIKTGKNWGWLTGALAV